VRLTFADGLLPAPSQSDLPSASSQTDPSLDAFVTVLLTDDCSHGYIVTVSPTKSVRLVAAAYDDSRRGLLAMVLGHVRSTRASLNAPVGVTAFAGGREVGHADVHF
jgi:hypothetical protein